MTGVVLDVPFDAVMLAQKRQGQRKTYRFFIGGFGALTVLLVFATIGLMATVWSVPGLAVLVGLIMAALLTASIGGVYVGVRGDGQPVDWAQPHAAPPVAIRVTTSGLWLAGGDPVAGTTYAWEELQALTVQTGSYYGTTWLEVRPSRHFVLGVTAPDDPVCAFERFRGMTGIAVLPETLGVPVQQLDQAIRQASGGRWGIQAR